MRKIIYTEKFIKELNRFNRKQQLQINKKIELFKTGLYDKQLKSHKLNGNLANNYAFSINRSLRIVYSIIKGKVKLYSLDDIGTHGQVYR
jgi:addiction module RelE/StbE family toxin